jgi:NADH:ubiquinone oxidoreductase subunit
LGNLFRIFAMAKLRRLKATCRFMLNGSSMLCRRINHRALLCKRKSDFAHPCGHIPRNFTNPSGGGSSMKEYLIQFFTWWNGQTLGTRFHTWRKGQFVGQDEFGNKYYRHVHSEAIDPNVGTERRWVIYNGEADASKEPPVGAPGCATTGTYLRARKPTSRARGEKPYVPNMTGTGDYVPWTPGE